MNENQKQGPPGLSWLWSIVYSHGFWIGFIVVLLMTPILMSLIQLAWSGRIPSWEEQYKSFIIGDVLLALIAGIIAAIAQHKSEKGFTTTKNYWNKWLLVGVVISLIFISLQSEGISSWWNLLQPQIFYHHIILIVILVPLLAGMGYAEFKRKPHNKLWIIVGLLFLGYIFLQIYDIARPPKPNLPALPGSLEMILVTE